MGTRYERERANEEGRPKLEARIKAQSPRGFDRLDLSTNLRIYESTILRF